MRKKWKPKEQCLESRPFKSNNIIGKYSRSGKRGDSLVADLLLTDQFLLEHDNYSKESNTELVKVSHFYYHPLS